jgi:hypothetical protein
MQSDVLPQSDPTMMIFFQIIAIMEPMNFPELDTSEGSCFTPPFVAVQTMLCTGLLVLLELSLIVSSSKLYNYCHPTAGNAELTIDYWSWSWNLYAKF